MKKRFDLVTVMQRDTGADGEGSVGHEERS